VLATCDGVQICFDRSMDSLIFDCYWMLVLWLKCGFTVAADEVASLKNVQM